MKDEIKKKLKNNKVLYAIANTVWRFYYDIIMLKIIGSLFRVFPVKNNKIVICNFWGQGYGENPKAVAEELLKIDKEKKLDIIWMLNKNNFNTNVLPERIKKVKYNSYKCLYHLVTAKVWLDNSRKEFVPIKRKKQYYIQTWHGAIGIKKAEKFSQDSLPKRYIKLAKKDSKNADLFVSGSKWQSKFYRDAFWYDGEILAEGIPKNDILFHNEKHEEIKDKVFKFFNIDKNTKVLLYAPTFRKNGNLDCYNINFTNVMDVLKNRTKTNWVSLIRLHPNIANRSNELNFSENTIDVSNYPDIYELMIATDMLITDYSSVAFDFSYLKRPAFLYATDIDQYLSDRGFLFDYFSLPFNVSKNNQELINDINNFNEDKYINDLNNFYIEVGLNETGKSSEKIAKIILEKCEIKYDKN